MVHPPSPPPFPSPHHPASKKGKGEKKICQSSQGAPGERSCSRGRSLRKAVLPNINHVQVGNVESLETGTTTMARLSSLPASVVLLLLLAVTAVQGLGDSGISVVDGVYSGVTVRVGQVVPRHLCFRVLNNLEVRKDKSLPPPPPKKKFLQTTIGRKVFGGNPSFFFHENDYKLVRGESQMIIATSISLPPSLPPCCAPVL